MRLGILLCGGNCIYTKNTIVRQQWTMNQMLALIGMFLHNICIYPLSITKKYSNIRPIKILKDLNIFNYHLLLKFLYIKEKECSLIWELKMKINTFKFLRCTQWCSIEVCSRYFLTLSRYDWRQIKYEFSNWMHPSWTIILHATHFSREPEK